MDKVAPLIAFIAQRRYLQAQDRIHVQQGPSLLAFPSLQDATRDRRLTAVLSLCFLQTLAHLDLLKQAAAIGQARRRSGGGHRGWWRRTAGRHGWRGRSSAAWRHGRWWGSAARWHWRWWRRGAGSGRVGLRGVIHRRHWAGWCHGAEEDGSEVFRATTTRRLVVVFLIVAGLDNGPVVVVRGLGARTTRGLGLGEGGLAVLCCLHGVEGVVILLCLGRCNGGSAGGGRLLVHALPERILGFLWGTLDRGRARGSWLRLWLGDCWDQHACRRGGVIGRDASGAFLVVTAVVVADGLKLCSELALSFFSRLDLSALGSKTSFLLGRVFLGCCTALLLFCPLQLAGLNLLFKRAERSFLLFALLLQLTLLSCFLVPV